MTKLKDILMKKSQKGMTMSIYYGTVMDGRWMTTRLDARTSSVSFRLWMDDECVFSSVNVALYEKTRRANQLLEEERLERMRRFAALCNSIDVEPRPVDHDHLAMLRKKAGLT